MKCPYCGAELNCKEYVENKLQGRFNVADVLREITNWENQISKHTGEGKRASCAEKHAKSGVLTVSIKNAGKGEK